MLLKRTKTARKKSAGWTDAKGFKTEDAPKNWPFGVRRNPTVSKAKPRITRARALKEETDQETILKGFMQ